MNTNKISIMLVSITAIIFLICGAFFTMGGMVNTGSNVPPGLYWKVDKPLAVGKTVVFCPPNRPEFQEARARKQINDGSCPDNFERLMLKVAAKFKDKVTINDTGVYVNDTFYPQSQPLLQDRGGQPISRLAMENYELKENELLLMSDFNKDPFDGRYFGIINTEQVDSVIHLIFP
jgi:conjugative transfer signal peptidase TraF